jgi:hypothetical protein
MDDFALDQAMKRAAFSCGLVAALAGGCGSTEQDRVSLPLFLAGTDLSEPVEAAGNVLVEVEQAQLAFGPFYICAGATAGDLCDTARLEWLGTSVIELMSSDPQEVGELLGVTGQVRSFMYDLGISSQLSSQEPVVLDAASELGGASFVMNGRAQVEGIWLPFRVAVPVMQSDTTELGVPVIRKSTSETFFHEVENDERGLLVQFDAAPWIASIDFRPYVEDASCELGGPEVVCAQAFEQTCDEDGHLTQTRDCSTLSQVCVPGRGCVDELIIDSESEAYRSLRNALLVGARPRFEFGYAP